MILFFVYDALFFGPLATPDFLSEVLIGREALAADVAVRLRVVRIVIFTVLHLTAFTALGIVLANLFRMSGVRKTLLLGGCMASLRARFSSAQACICRVPKCCQNRNGRPYCWATSWLALSWQATCRAERRYRDRLGPERKIRRGGQTSIP
jgi:hypothetical protein